MELPFGQAESPSNPRGIAGPSRARIQARQHRNSALKPYDRRSLLLAADGAQGRTDSLHSSSALSIRSAKSKAGDRDSVKGGGGGGLGLLSGLRQAIFSRPLSWLQGSATKTAASSTTLPSYAAPVLSAAQKLAASVKASGQSDDIETHSNGIAGKQKSIAPPTPNFNITSPITPAAFNYTPARSPSPARSSASAAIHSHGRQRLSVGPGSTLGTPGYRRSGSLRPDSGSLNGLAASQSSPSFAFGFGSERRMTGISSAFSTHNHIPPSPLPSSSSYHPLPSRSPFAMKRQSLAESSAGGSVIGYDRSPRTGGFQSFGTPSRSRPTSIFGGEFSRSRAGSVADSRMSTSSQTPKRREWSSLKMAPPKADLSAGEELMQAYLAMRNGAESSNAPAHPALQNGEGLPGSATDTLMMEFGAGTSSLQRHSDYIDDAPLKRGVSMSIDGDESMNEIGPRKRQKQMVWDSELGFVSKEDLRARRPPKPVAQNEAERLLNALEGLRSPAVGPSAKLSSRGGTVSEGYSDFRDEKDRLTYARLQPLRQMMPVSVPLPVPERSDIHTSTRQRKVEDMSKTVSPYSRAMRSKMSQSVEPEEGKGLKSRLRRPLGVDNKIERQNQSIEQNEETFEESMSRRESDDENTSMASEDEAEAEEDIIEPPRRKIVVSSRPEQEQEKKTLRSGKVLPPSPAKKAGASVLSTSKLGSTSTAASRPMSKARLEIPVSGASAASRQKAGQQPLQLVPTPKATATPMQSEGSQFQVRNDINTERSRSSLRQGAEKTHRSHGKSGRVGLDDDEDDEVDDLPSAEELNKIKLPTNLFPQGFTFSGTPSPSIGNTVSSPAPFKEATELTLKALPAPSNDVRKQDTGETSIKQNQEAAPPAEGGSLLGRLGGFAPASQPSSEPTKAAFSFTASPAASEQTTSTAKPTFSFQSSNTTSASDFFSAPTTDEKKSSVSVSTPSFVQKDGPIPNFFASSLAKADSKEEGNSTAHSPSLSFSFTKPAEVKAPESNTGPTTTAPFSFGAPPTSAASGSSNTFSAPSQPILFGKASESKTVAPSFSFTPNTTSKESPSTFQGFGKPAESAKDSSDQSAPPAFGGFGSKPVEATATSGSPFSFGSAPKKREAEEQDGGPAKRSNGFTPSPSFGFNNSTAKSDGFSFGAPKAGKEGSTGTFGTPMQFKSQLGNNEPKAAEPLQSGGFSFGGSGKSEMMDTSPSSGVNGSNTAVSANVYAVSSPTPAPSKPAFSFGAPAVSSAPSSVMPAASHSGFSFGLNSPVKSSSTLASAPSFSFGGANPAASNKNSGNLFGQLSAAPASNPFGGGGGGAPSNAPSTGGFGNGGFESSNNAAADGSRQSSPAPFSFGGASTQPTAGGFGGGFGQNNHSTVTSPSTPAFAFDAPSAVSAPTTPGGGNNTGFSFSVPNANGAGVSNSFAMPTAGAAPSQPSTFVFGSASGTSTPPTQQAGGGGFGFNMGSSAPQSPVGGTSNLFNMGSAPPPGSGGNRPMRGMPARRKR